MLVTILVLVIGLPMAFYLLLSTDWAQQRLCRAGDEALTRLLGSDVNIESINFSPFNKILINNVKVQDDNGEECAMVNSIEARFELLDFIFDQKIILDYIVLEGLNLNLYKESKDTQINIANIIEHLKRPDKQSETSSFNVRLNNIEILDSRFSYNVLSEPHTPDKFNINHIQITDFNCQIFVPVLSNDIYDVQIVSLSAQEQSGLNLSDLKIKCLLSTQGVKIEDFVVRMPDSKLMFAPIEIAGDWKKVLPKAFTSVPIGIAVLPNSRIMLSDLAPFVPDFSKFSQKILIELETYGKIDSLEVRNLNLAIDNNRLKVDVKGNLYDINSPKEMTFENIEAKIVSSNGALKQILTDLGVKLNPNLLNIIDVCRNSTVLLHYNGMLSKGSGDLRLASDAGDINLKGNFVNHNKEYDITAKINLVDIQLDKILKSPNLGSCFGEINVEGRVGRVMKGEVTAYFNSFEFNNYNYEDLELNLNVNPNSYQALFKCNDSNADFSISAFAQKDSIVDFDIITKIQSVDLDAINLYKKYPRHSLSGTVTARGRGRSLSMGLCEVDIHNLWYLNESKHGLRIDEIHLDADNTQGLGVINLNADFIKGSVQGQYDVTTIGKSLMTLLGEVFPSYAEISGLDRFDDKGELIKLGNNFAYDFTIQDAESICDFFKLPVVILDPVNINGIVLDDRQRATLNLDAQWLIQGSNLVENTYVSVNLDGLNRDGSIYATVHYPTKKGPMDLVTTINAENDHLATNIDWEIVRDNPINGNINFDTYIYKNQNQKLCIDADFKPGLINFGNEVWKIRPSHIYYSDKFLQVRRFALEAPTQSVIIDGAASEYPLDFLSVKLNGIQLLDIFETLDIDKALICGNATGTLKVSEIFTSKPQIESTNFFVKDMGYNGCVLGDGNIKINYDVEKEAFCFDAILDQAEGYQSKIKGSIVPAEEYLDFDFDAHHVKVGFLKPFMEAFCSDIEGYATGNAHLFGTFKYIDLEGDLYADTVRLKIDFTNTWYSASDSIRIQPGMIDLNNIKIYDEQGHSALLNGYVKHFYFHEPEFDFSITGAKDFLSYNTTKADNPRWYGTIYGNGSAHVIGVPGVVNINVAMSSAPKSTFTFELLDDEEAAEYSFIVFNDATPVVIGDAYTDLKMTSKAEEKAKSMRKLEEEEQPTDYRMDIKVDITPQAQVNIVMDPIGGDCIHANGSGQMHLTYNSTDEDLRLIGTYVLEKGDYNFTLQDILIKNFTIRQGSSISFTGDPYAAQLDINAIYSVNANLSDLDESFLQDKDLNRTNVPVYAVMKVTGNMLQPDIAFDLEFPTLQQDVYRKVRSIVSTDDMMNRQIIYLLALNRFYTPEYMASTTKGNELFSVASATISSQLSNMLGKLSDNWSIAPNLRSDRGDFSDVEVDLTLSSSLLNNRLLFNGNFGYRDKSLNQNQFIGDFDIEYLLNRGGNLRLKAYNRYNDQNYYLRTAQTTQGVGIIWRRDFDNLFNFLRKKKSESEK